MANAFTKTQLMVALPLDEVIVSAPTCLASGAGSPSNSTLQGAFIFCVAFSPSITGVCTLVFMSFLALGKE
jgi:hypothetical protein